MSAVFVLPVVEVGLGAPVASLLSTAAWAEAGARVHGRSWIVSPAGVLDPAGARRLATAADADPTATDPVVPEPTGPDRTGRPPARRILDAVPTPAKTFVKDVRSLVRGRRFQIGPGPWDDGSVELVWQRHELYQTAGVDLADRLGVPSVVFTPATKVWEATRWGTIRPGWGAITERLGESPVLRRADLVACGSEAVAEQAIRLGTPADRVLVTPNGVDVERFASGDRRAGRRWIGLDPDGDQDTDPDEVVVGWVGSFRPFHDLDHLVDAMRGIDRLHLLLVGDGPERATVESRARDLGIVVTCTGTVDHGALPDLLAAMDVAVVVTSRADTFHYSPLKLGEYLAAGLAVIAPDVASVRDRTEDGRDLLLVPPGDRGALREAIRALRDDPGRRAALGVAGRATAQRSFSWDHQLRRIDTHLGTREGHEEPPRRAGAHD